MIPTTLEYTSAIVRMVEEFVKRYYTDDDGSSSEYYIISQDSDLAPWPIEIDDMYWSADNIYEALKNNIPKGKLFDWYFYHTDRLMRWEESSLNLTTYAKAELWPDEKVDFIMASEAQDWEAIDIRNIEIWAKIKAEITKDGNTVDTILTYSGMDWAYANLATPEWELIPIRCKLKKNWEFYYLA